MCYNTYNGLTKPDSLQIEMLQISITLHDLTNTVYHFEIMTVVVHKLVLLKWRYLFTQIDYFLLIFMQVTSVMSIFMVRLSMLIMLFRLDLKLARFILLLFLLPLDVCFERRFYFIQLVVSEGDRAQVLVVSQRFEHWQVGFRLHRVQTNV